MIFKPHDYQKYAIEHIIKNPYCGLFLDMGLGKTVTTLTALELLKNDYFLVGKILVIAPLRVALDTWPSEIKKWDHLKHLTVSKILGSEAKRKQALYEKADIHVINRENIPWLISLCGRGFPFDTVVIDELSSFKSAAAHRFKAMRMIRPYISRVIGLTGTPAPNGLIDLWPQMFLLDMGERLGKTLTSYRDRYFKPDKRNGMVVYSYKMKTGNEHTEIYSKISDICVSMKSEDYLKIPDRIDQKVIIKLDSKQQKAYDDFEREQVLQLIGGEITAVNAAALTTKLLQYSNGAVYDADKQVHIVHDAKLEALDEILDTANSQPVLVFYTYKHDLERISKRFKAYKPSELKTSTDIQLWNEGKKPLLLAHPASAGHGLNLQAGGHIIVWFGLTWSLELYQQANARLHRQGQQHGVVIHHLVCRETIDEDVLDALTRKSVGQDALMDAVKARIRKYT